MFLNNFDKRDQNAGVNVKLREVYLDDHLPHYIWGNNESRFADLKYLLIEYVEEYNDNKMLLILGQPGIGKSTLITWITANLKKRRDDILVYQFATDLKDINWYDVDVFFKIVEKLNLVEDLDKKILIFDGFDEISVGIDRKEVLNRIWFIIKMYSEKFSVIVTCRENYILDLERIKCTYITLQPWDDKQIKSFCTVYQEKVNTDISEKTKATLLENKEILGVPLILYMTLALNISIDKEGSIVDIYDQIFSLKSGGIYDRCIKNNSYADLHRIGKIKGQIHLISKMIAVWMFENNPDEGYIPKKEYEKISKTVEKINKNRHEDRDISKDFLIGNYFKMIKHCEGIETETLYFVHRSIYEYFVTESIYSSIKESLELLTKKVKKNF